MKRFKKPTEPSIPRKHFVPEKSSISSLNHLIENGGVPLTSTLKSTKESGIAFWLSGFTMKLGGSTTLKKVYLKSILKEELILHFIFTKNF